MSDSKGQITFHFEGQQHLFQKTKFLTFSQLQTFVLNHFQIPFATILYKDPLRDQWCEMDAFIESHKAREFKVISEKNELDTCSFYHTVSPEQSAKMLVSLPQGSFMIRPSSVPHQLTLCIKLSDTFYYKRRIHFEKNKYIFRNESFSHIDDLLQREKNCKIPFYRNTYTDYNLNPEYNTIYSELSIDEEDYKK